jgi:flagellin
MKASQLSTGVQNLSGFNSLQDINLMDADKAQDAIRLVDRAIEEVAAARGELGAFQKNSLESNLNFLRIAHENVSSSESVIRDADMAQEMAAFTRNQIMTDSTMAMLAQANQSQRRVVQLLS